MFDRYRLLLAAHLLVEVHLNLRDLMVYPLVLKLLGIVD